MDTDTQIARKIFRRNTVMVLNGTGKNVIVVLWQSHIGQGPESEGEIEWLRKAVPC